MCIAKIIRIAGAACLVLFAGSAQASKLYISEYSNIGLSTALSGDQPPIAKEPGADQSPVDFTSGATSSAAFAATTRFVRVICDVQCSVKFGASPTATNANKPLSAMTPEYFGVNPGDKISVIANP